MVSITLSANADWFLDFDTPPPPSFIAVGLTLDSTPSPTFEWSVDGGFLTLSDSTPPSEGGSYNAFATVINEKFTDVRVTGTVNVTGTTTNDLVLLARGNIATLSTYTAGIEFATGLALISKIVNGSIVDQVLSPSPLTNLAASYFLQFDAVGNQLTCRVFDYEGGTELRVVNYTDTGVGGPAFTSGMSGVGAEGPHTNLSLPVDGTFDNVASIALSEAAIKGRVTDADTGNPIKWALVIAVNADTKDKYKAFTDRNGDYEISDLSPGTYWVICIKKGYELGIKKAVVEAGKETTVNFKLKLKLPE